MSEHEKPQEHLVYDYDEPPRSNQDTSFPGFSQPSLPAQLPITRAHDSHGAPATGPTPYLSGISYGPRDVHTQYSPFIPSASRPVPPQVIVTSYSPRSGSYGTKLEVRIRLSYDLSSYPGVSFSISFGAMRAQATVTKFDAGDDFHHYVLESDIPAFDPSVSPGTQVPLLLNMQDDYGTSLGAVEVGDFTFGYPSAYQYQTGTNTGLTRKRKQSEEPYVRSPPKRSVSQQMVNRMRAPSTGYAPPQGQMSPYLRSASSGTYGLQPQLPAQQMYAPGGGQAQSYAYPLAPYQQQQEMPSPGMQPSIYGAVSRGSSLSVPPAPATMAIALPSTTSSSAPTLVRTSSIQPSGSLAQPSTTAAPAFNPYAMYPNSKAVLKIDGDLDKMAVDWTEEEWEAKRRLVQFQRSQTGSTIVTTFEPVTPEERKPNSICISCIWWEEKKECYVTSVDTIYLLESLVAVRFTVEEKNRIRRNLEGFRPMTVSKAKADSEEFFKVIMGFPNPKPRNIEKDVKVFPWKILAHALKKIIGKYSASYSSTAGALLTPAAASYTSGGHTSGSEAGTEQHVTASPRSVSSSSAPPPHHRASSMTTTARSPNIPMLGPRTTALDMRASGGNQPGDQLRGMMPQEHMGTPHGLPSYGQPGGWSQMPQYSSGLPNTARPSWDLSAYIGTSPAAVTALPASAQQSQHYYRTPSMSSAGQEQGQDLGGGSYDMYNTGSAGPGGDSQRTSNA
ncbi:hypothetical protein NA57DRAFT_73145 [Rhizodiscina lignyota]|uniref:DUF7082 domain-containing protein n=1 Tax=Rhizodiscina lignyota TaxID=1504668 RepID=A0A9P4ILY4_9PEZI|nr:hypothetical protein NA57DRAFT_73145 [Rhizodiscina lignyota]